jgi:fatty-acyl-CoA synthase
LLGVAVLVGDIVRLNGKFRGGDTALIIGDLHLTYGEMNEKVDAVAAALIAADVQIGDRVAVLGKNTLEYILLYFATAKVGALLVPMNFWHRAAEHDYTIENSDPKLLFAEPEFVPLVNAAGRRLVTLPMNGDELSWNDFMADGVSSEPARAIVPDDPHMILYTSGTTGRPKGAVLTHRRTMDDAFFLASVFGPRRTDTFINYFPPFHVGNWDHMKLFLVVGARVVILRQFDSTEVLRAIERERITVILGVPTMLHDLLSNDEFERTDKSSIRLVYYGAYDPSDVMRRTADAFGVTAGRTQMAHIYGLTESGPFSTYCAPHEIMDHWGSIGLPIPGVDVELRDEEGNVVPRGAPGELCILGPSMTGYWNNPEATAAALEGGWLHTGDVCVEDDDGFLYIVDRKKDMIRSGGQNIYSKTVEDCLLLHPAVQEVGVIGLPDDVYEERVCAIIVLREGFIGDDKLKEEIQQYVRTSIAGYNMPRTIHFTDSLPRTMIGKIQKHILREKYGSMFDSAKK